MSIQVSVCENLHRNGRQSGVCEINVFYCTLEFYFANAILMYYLKIYIQM